MPRNVDLLGAAFARWYAPRKHEQPDWSLAYLNWYVERGYPATGWLQSWFLVEAELIARGLIPPLDPEVTRLAEQVIRDRKAGTGQAA